MSETKVLVPLDGSKLAESALGYVAQLDTLGEIHLQLISVADPMEASGFTDEKDWLERNSRILTAYVEDQAERLRRSHSDWLIGTEVHQGEPSEAILSAVEHFRPEFVALSTHGRSGMTRWRLGSVADKIVRAANCDVLAIGPRPGAEQAASHITAVLVPLDGSDMAEQALPMAEAIVKATGAKLHLVRAVPMPMLVGDGMSYSYLPEQLEAMEGLAKSYLARMAIKLVQQQPSTTAIQGNAADVLVEYIARHNIDLVVMTSHGRRGLLRTTLGSVTDRLLGSEAPVYVVRSQPLAGQAEMK